MTVWATSFSFSSCFDGRYPGGENHVEAAADTCRDLYLPGFHPHHVCHGSAGVHLVVGEPCQLGSAQVRVELGHVEPGKLFGELRRQPVAVGRLHIGLQVDELGRLGRLPHLVEGQGPGSDRYPLVHVDQFELPAGAAALRELLQEPLLVPRRFLGQRYADFFPSAWRSRLVVRRPGGIGRDDINPVVPTVSRISHWATGAAIADGFTHRPMR